MEILRRFDLDPVQTLVWVREVVGEPSQAPRILNDKGWSIVLHLGIAVLKVTSAGAFLSRIMVRTMLPVGLDVRSAAGRKLATGQGKLRYNSTLWLFPG